MAKTSFSLRARALQKIAELSSTISHGHDEINDFSKLYKMLQHIQNPSKFNQTLPSLENSLSQTPMAAEELRVLLALCDAGSLIESSEEAHTLFLQLRLYLLEVHEQSLVLSPFLQSIEPSPWEAVTKALTKAILVLGIRHSFLAKSATECTFDYIENCMQAVGSKTGQRNGSMAIPKNQRPAEKIMLFMSILGFLEATSHFVNLFSPSQRLELVLRVKNLVSDDFMIAVEGALSSLRNADFTTRLERDFQQVMDKYSRLGRPLGAMLLQESFMKLLVSCSALEITNSTVLQRSSILDHLMPLAKPHKMARTDGARSISKTLAEIVGEYMRVLEDGADYLELGSSSQHHLAFNVKGHALTVFLICVLIDDEIADPDALMTWLENVLTDPVQMADHNLASVIFKCLAILARLSPAFATSLSRLIPRFIVQSGNETECVETAAKCFAFVLQGLSQDAVITSLYSLGNVLSASNAETVIQPNTTVGQKANMRYTQHSTTSAISFAAQGDEEAAGVYANVIKAIITVATFSKDRKIIPLAQSMLIQKLNRVNTAVDAIIITETAALGIVSEQTELKSLLKLYDRIGHDAVLNQKYNIVDAVRKALVKLALGVPRNSPSFHLYLSHLLEAIVAKGDVREKREKHDQQRADVQLAAEEIGQLLLPLSILAPHFPKNIGSMGDEESTSLQREVWFNIAVHSIVPGTELWQKHQFELHRLAIHTQPLVGADHTSHLEGDIELNTVLRRGMNGPYITEMKRNLIRLLPEQEHKVRPLAYEKVIFLLAAYSVETLRAENGACADVLSYFVDPSVKQEGTRECMAAIASHSVGIFLNACETLLRSGSPATLVAKELAKILTMCCHRIPQCQEMAMLLAEKLILSIPPALCEKSSLFTLLELLTIMWSSCLEAEIDEYEWKSSYVSSLTDVCLELSDDYEYRRKTLKLFHKKARIWVGKVINLAPLDVKGLFQTYLSEFDDDGAYGHVALGRSFAVEMGSAIPSSDPRLGAISDYDEHKIDTASDFVAQYTTRQEYKYAEAIPADERDRIETIQLNGKSNDSDPQAKDALAILIVLDQRASDNQYIPFSEVRDLLRRAAAIVCRSIGDQCSIIHHLVGIPFSIFTKQALKLGVSLWLGVINENPSMESRILVEIIESLERSIQQNKGVFSDASTHLDPFYLKEEYEPSDRQSLVKRQHYATNIIAPHLRVLQFLSSHLEAYRIGSPHLRKSYQRMISVVLQGVKFSACHPLTREFHFQVVHFALAILKYSSDLSYSLRWRLKDQILSAALAWFIHSPRFTFGGNRIQVKAECKLLVEVEAALDQVKSVGLNATNVLPSLAAKHDLLLRFMRHEHSRLHVWLYPTLQDAARTSSSIPADKIALSTINRSLLKVAWEESPSLALQIATRSQVPALYMDARWELVNRTEAAINDPAALHMLFDNGLPHDVTFQLKYLLYWKPINPISAVTYFLPAYRNHPFVIQYAMRALENHSVDITFFYVPQIVQTLRYDELGYVQRYIIETAKVSQLFAHQIIWNMKANAYKDEDSTVEDELKPTLDVVMQNMVGSFSRPDKAFYEKEFAFFNEVTGISGKLRPYIKKEKSEKKQKIEEELRKIKVEIGVYLPSNPDGVVIGIDRKSGKPLQSHAKAPYMATFRIRKNKTDIVDLWSSPEPTVQDDASKRRTPNTQETTYDIWQSAIFKVGDDCRQDVLALQMISAFRNIFNDVGLDVWVYPYRVIATAPGCGVIEVLPNSISRDMLGREAVNGLHDYFVSKYGGHDSIKYQEARNNFVKSMASYSVISYLLQFKDRHNGNIMIDDAGHIIHIDFGFCFDIAPGGVKFERAPFKLTAEMVAVMGGHTTSQSFKWFEELCVKAFLASRPHAEKLSHLVVLMLDSGLPCFKPETIQHFKDRFVLAKNERDAADFMRELIRKSHSSYSTKGYDHFQLLTNGIPY